MAEDLAGRAAFVTGGASGIGRATALAFAAKGAAVMVADVAEAEGEKTAETIRAGGGKARFVRCDVTESASVQAAIAATVSAFGRLDCAHNNAGILGTPGAFADYPEDMFDRVIATNLRGVFLCMKHELKHMLAHGGGAIVNTSSVAGILGSPTLCAYNASKHGVIGLTKSAAVDAGPHNIRVNAVCPGFIDTPMTQRGFGGTAGRGAELHVTGKVGRPEEIAAAVVWLCSDAASLVTGIAMPVDGAWTIRP